MYVAALTFAENSLHMTNAYFAPDSQIIKALTDAAKRGVDVEIVLPGTTDRSLALYAGQYHFSDLLKSGVKLYKRRNVLLHAKTLVIDGVWSTVGSTNMEGWSFSTNDEVNAVILSREFAAEMERCLPGILRSPKKFYGKRGKRDLCSSRSGSGFGICLPAGRTRTSKMGLLRCFVNRCLWLRTVPAMNF